MNAEGFEIHENIISLAECQGLLSWIESWSSRAGVRNLMSDDRVASLANDKRIISLVERFAGSPLFPFKATLFNKTAKANWLVAWHQDTALPIETYPPSDGWSAPSLKAGILHAHAPTPALEKIFALRVHLDGSTETNGPLRVIPGSHRHGVLNDEEVKRCVRSEEPVECIVGRGGVIVLSPLLLHASSKLISDEPRRVLHIEYAKSLEITPGIRLAIS